MEWLGMFPHFVLESWWLHMSQTLLTSFLGSFLFLLLALSYHFFKKYSPRLWFVLLIDSAIGGYIEFVDDIAPEISPRAKIIPVLIFFYILWNNILGVIIDMFSGVPFIHHYFRPVTTDILFNLVLAIIGVVGALIYGTMQWGWHFWEKYFPVHGIGIVPKVQSVGTFIGKCFDILLWFLVGSLELIGEIAKMMSLSLRLFGNVLAGVVLLGLWIAGGNALGHLIFGMDVPLILPLLVFFLELFVGTLQSFVFSLLVVVYFKMSATAH